jgi:hypothetical protein
MGLTGFEVEVQRETEDGGFVTEDMTLSMGPQHPSTHGVLRFVVRADGEVMKEAIPDIGYLHRSIEKIAEKVGWHGFLPYTDRVDYVAAMFCNHGWTMACEVAGIQVPKRGEYCRVIADGSAAAQPSLRSARWRWTSAPSRRSPTPSASGSTERPRELAARASPSTTCGSAASAGTCARWIEKMSISSTFELTPRVRSPDLLQQTPHRAWGTCCVIAGGGDRSTLVGPICARSSALTSAGDSVPVYPKQSSTFGRQGEWRGRRFDLLHRPHAVMRRADSASAASRTAPCGGADLSRRRRPPCAESARGDMGGTSSPRDRVSIVEDPHGSFPISMCRSQPELMSPT